MSSPYFYYALPLLLNLPVERKCRDSCWWSRCYCFCYCYRMRPQQPLSSRCLSSPGDRRFCRRRRLRRFLFTFELLSLFLRLSRKKRSFLPRATNNKERTQPRWQWLQFFFKFVAKSPALSTEQTDQWHTFVHSLSHLLFSIRDNFRFDLRSTDRPTVTAQPNVVVSRWCHVFRWRCICHRLSDGMCPQKRQNFCTLHTLTWMNSTYTTLTYWIQFV